jgi:hypothetical protein
MHELLHGANTPARRGDVNWDMAVPLDFNCCDNGLFQCDASVEGNFAVNIELRITHGAHGV